MSAPDKITTSRCCKQIVQSGMNEWPSDVEYTRSDLIPAMLAKAHAEGREQGLREAAAHVGVRVGRHGTGFTQNCQCGMCNARREDHVFILDLLDTPAPDAEEGGE